MRFTVIPTPDVPGRFLADDKRRARGRRDSWVGPPGPHYAPRVDKPNIDVVREGHASDPGLDTAVSRALLIEASAGQIPETFRLNLPGRVVAFGKRDTLLDGYRRAVRAARTQGFEAVERLAGGRAAAFHEGALAFSWSIPEPDPRSGITARFEQLSSLMVRAFGRLGVDAAVGELPGEYCPGAHSVHAGGRIKLMGVGQRLAKNAAHVGGVVVVSHSKLLRDILEPVYSALGLEWDPNTAGALQDVAPGVTMQEVAGVILDELATIRTPRHTSIERRTMQLAAELAPEHLAA